MHWEPKPKNVIIARLGWTWIIYHNQCNYFSYNFTSLLLLWPPLLHCGTSGLHEHISPPRPHISGYWADLLNTFYSSINQIKENKFWCLFAFQNSALPEKCHSVTTLFHLSMVSFFPFFFFFFIFLDHTCQKAHRNYFLRDVPTCSDSDRSSSVWHMRQCDHSPCYSAPGSKDFTECLMSGLTWWKWRKHRGTRLVCSYLQRDEQVPAGLLFCFPQLM